MDAYHADYWPLRTFYTQESSYPSVVSFIPCRPLGLVLFDSLVISVRGWKWVLVCIAYILAHSCVLDVFWTHTWHDDHIGYSYFILSKICSLDLLNVFLPCLILISYHSILLHSLDPKYGLSSSNFSSLNMCIWFHSHFRDMHTLRRNSYYIGLLDFSVHFGICCQWGRSLEGLR